MNPMRVTAKFRISILAVIYLFMFPSVTKANVSYEISGNNGTAEVNIEQHSSTTINRSTSNSVHTTIDVETNGKKETITSDSPGSINVESINGKTTVKISPYPTQPASNSSIFHQESIRIMTATATESAKQQIDDASEKVQGVQDSIKQTWQKDQSWIDQHILQHPIIRMILRFFHVQ